MQIEETAPPEGSLIAPFAAAEGHYTDAFRTKAPADADLSALVIKFYTSPIFRLERLVLRAAGVRSSDTDVHQLAMGDAQRFAVWQVAERRDAEILLDERSGRTKSWLAVHDGDVWFGSVVVPVMRKGRLTLGPVFQSLETAHKVYSRALLAAAVRGLQKTA